MNEQTKTSQTTSATPKRHGCLRYGLIFIGGLLVVLLVLVIGGMIYESRAETAVAAQFPAPGEIVEVNGRDMHINCMGQGSPTIILDAGQGGWSSSWIDIMAELSQESRVCAYDRAGYGWSEVAHDGRTPQDAADDLSSLLDAANIAPPYILVGFSHAGLGDRVFAAQHRSDMAGMVLIDPATEFDNEIMGEDLLRQQQSTAGMFKGFGLLARLGLLRLMGTNNMAGSAPFITVDPADPDVYYTFIAAPQWWDISEQEFSSGMNEKNNQMVRENGQIQDIPLVIIGSEQFKDADNVALQNLQTARDVKLAELAAQSTQGEFVLAANSSHNIPTEHPQMVIEAIQSITTASQ